MACDAFVNVAFTAGIMHDIGRLGLLVAYPGEYERVIRTAAERSLDVLDFEAEEFGAHHAEAGRLLAETWGLPADMALIAGRHHDPCEGIEVDLLRIVHVACRLADVLGYDVVKPLIPSKPSDVLAQLPARARGRMTRAPAELCERIEERILEFGSEPADAPPEETLALLAAAGVTDNQETAPGVVERVAELDTLESAASPIRKRWKLTIILWIAAGLAAVAGAALWFLR